MDRLVEIPIGDEEADPRQVVRLRLTVGGIVQGVGFRPFIYRLATRCDLAGYVLNHPGGVEIEIQGELEKVGSFLEAMEKEKPPLARIDTMKAHFMDVLNEAGFVIRESRPSSERTVLISPDIATCEDCLHELFEKNDRRYRYPFINCTNCGPRFTIIRDIPYDRTNTTMDVFPMCPKCQQEYEDPINRRFHAEPNACWVCGPKVTVRDAAGEEVQTDSPISLAKKFLKEGKIVAVKGLGGFHLAVDATNDEAVARLRLRKHREEKPLAIMARDIATVSRFAILSKADEDLLRRPARPIVLVRKLPNSIIAESVAPKNRNLGVMLPYTPLHHLLLEDFTALVMTSGNISEEPIVIDIEDAGRRLRGIADYYLDHNRRILARCDDSVVKSIDGGMVFFRRSRGWVPLPITIDLAPKPILATGAHLKNTIALTRGNQVFLSQHIGDLENLAALRFFEQTISHFEKILEVEPQIVAHDLHPDYLSTRYASSRKHLERIGVQHHHAHIASCLGEAGIDGPVIGFAFDGTGYGDDGTIWGGEVMVATRDRYERVGYLERVPIPGGEAAIRNPWRMAVAHLRNAFGEELERVGVETLVGRSTVDVEAILSMIRSDFNCPLTSSCGRLFDAVSSLCGVCDQVTYEGQAAIELEMLADEAEEKAYPVEIQNGHPIVIGTKGLIRRIVEDLQKGEDRSRISKRFHNWLTLAILETAIILREATGITRVALSGGCFQNEILLTRSSRLLKEQNFEVLINRRVPLNDGGISFGQVIVAASKVAKR